MCEFSETGLVQRTGGVAFVLDMGCGATAVLDFLVCSAQNQPIVAEIEREREREREMGYTGAMGVWKYYKMDEDIRRQMRRSGQSGECPLVH
jgi:hypothetical protein